MKWRSLEESTPGPDTRSLRDILSGRKELIVRYVPPDIQAVHARVIRELKEDSFAEKLLGVGAKVSAFKLEDQNRKLVSSADLLSQGRLVICFFRGRWCPFCVGQLEAMSLLAPRIEQIGASLVAISPQTVQQSYFMVDQHKLRFPLLSDAGNQVARQFGLVYRVPDDQQAIYRRAFVNLPFANGDDSWELPIPATFIIDHDNSILYASADEDYTQRPEPQEILQQLSSRGPTQSRSFQL
jgi:peroxiredoxin